MTDPPIRASTMGFHDGVVSIGVMILSLLHAGVPDVLTSAIAASMAGALSMGLSEFQAVNTARDNDLKHEGAWKAAGSSFVSFVLGSAVPMMVVWYGGGFVDVLVSIFVALAATSVSQWGERVPIPVCDHGGPGGLVVVWSLAAAPGRMTNLFS